MKDKIVYGLIFSLLFAIVSAGMIYFNSKYKNIFAFDFSPRVDELQLKKDLTKADSLKVDSLKADSLKTLSDTLKTKETEVEKKDNLKPQTQTAQNNLSTEVPFRIQASENTKAKKDSIYNEWVKQTVKIYESMDSKKAAKVISNYSDNIARDILLKMKKKKAAEILAELKPEVVTRIISVN